MTSGIDGFQIYEQLKADPVTRAIGIIAMRGCDIGDYFDRIPVAGADVCLA